MLSLAAWLEPFEGDLTRVGGKAENFFGWNRPQASFPRNLTRYYTEGGRHYDGSEDIVLFGDSFSQMGLGDGRGFGWQNYLTAATSLDVFTYNVGVTDIREWLRRQPADQMPKYFIFQRIERRLSETKADTAACQIGLRDIDVSAMRLIDSATASSTSVRPPRRPLELQTAVHWLKANLRKNDETVLLDLIGPGLFSNVRSDKILVYKNDFLADEERRRNADVSRLACYLEEIRELAESKGGTKFLLAVAPDKSTAYRNVTVPTTSGKDLFALLREQGVRVVSFDKIFQANVAEGVEDLYLPNDTHWGSEGSRLFASVVVEALRALESDGDAITQNGE